MPRRDEMLDYQFLGLVAVVMAVVTRGSALAVLAVTALVALVTVGYDAAARRYARRQAEPPDAAPASDGEITRWMMVVDRVLRSTD